MSRKSRIPPDRVEQVRQLKAQKLPDRVIAEQLGLTMNQINYIRSLHGIGGRYAKYLTQLSDEK